MKRQLYKRGPSGGPDRGTSVGCGHDPSHLLSTDVLLVLSHYCFDHSSIAMDDHRGRKSKKQNTNSSTVDHNGGGTAMPTTAARKGSVNPSRSHPPPAAVAATGAMRNSGSFSNIDDDLELLSTSNPSVRARLQGIARFSLSVYEAPNIYTPEALAKLTQNPIFQSFVHRQLEEEYLCFIAPSPAFVSVWCIVLVVTYMGLFLPVIVIYGNLPIAWGSFLTLGLINVCLLAWNLRTASNANQVSSPGRSSTVDVPDLSQRSAGSTPQLDKARVAEWVLTISLATAAIVSGLTSGYFQQLCWETARTRDLNAWKNCFSGISTGDLNISLFAVGLFPLRLKFSAVAIIIPLAASILPRVVFIRGDADQFHASVAMLFFSSVLCAVFVLLRESLSRSMFKLYVDTQRQRSLLVRRKDLISDTLQAVAGVSELDRFLTAATTIQQVDFCTIGVCNIPNFPHFLTSTRLRSVLQEFDAFYGAIDQARRGHELRLLRGVGDSYVVAHGLLALEDNDDQELSVTDSSSGHACVRQSHAVRTLDRRFMGKDARIELNT